MSRDTDDAAPEDGPADDGESAPGPDAPSEGGTGDDAGPDVRDTDGDGAGGREVVVPLRVYKTVTVFSALIAIVSVVLGFVLLDAAVLRMSVLRTVVVAALDAIGLQVDRAVLSAVLAIAGLSVVAFGAAVYVVGTRFRAGEMGNSQEDSPEDSTNG